MNNLKEVNEQIEANKEILNTFPRNNAKNIKACLTQIQEYKQTFTDAQSKLLEEMKKRIEKLEEIKKSEEVIKLEEQVAEKERTLHVINKYKTSYEKMDLDRILFNLNVFYRKNLDVVNEAIQKAIEKFKEVGIPLMPKDFTYSKYANEYMVVFFQEMEKGNVNSERIKTEFEKIYWKCPDIIIHIRLNIFYIYTENEKNIDKYYEKKQEEALRNVTADQLLIEHKDIKTELIEKEEADKFNIINAFYTAKLNTKDYTEKLIKASYEKFIPKTTLAQIDESKKAEIDINLRKLLNSLWEYKNYLKFKFIIDDIKKKYAEKEQNKNAYAQTQKEIQTRESKLVKLNAKINGTGLFKKPNEKLNTEANNLILEIKQLYIELDRNKIKEKIFQEINENSTVFDALKLASSYYTYVYYCIQDNIKEITEEEIEQLIKELREFVNWPYYTILDNITLLNEKDVMAIIKDRYQLLKINITKEDLDKDNLDGVIDALEKIKTNQNLLKNNINIDELESECEFGKILKSK